MGQLRIVQLYIIELIICLHIFICSLMVATRDRHRLSITITSDHETHGRLIMTFLHLFWV